MTRAADALGGRDRVMALKTLQIVGYGELAYFNGGGNITGDPDAPQKWQKVLEYTRTIDLEHWRTRVQQRLKMDFVFASTIGQLGLNRTNETLDGDVAYNIGGGFLAAPQSGTPQPQPAGPAAARQRRVELLAHPITIVRAALDATSKLSNLRKQGNLQLVDVTVRQGDTLTLAVNATSNLPAWVSYVGPNANLGDVTYRTAFAGYVPEKGIQLPTGFATTIDFRNVVQSKLYVDRNIVDAPIDDLSAPASVRSAATPQGAPAGGNANLKPMKVADHVWYMNGNTFFEFDDHITMVEANRPDAALQAILEVVNALVPGKRVTQVIQSHHHFDHSVGLRAAVAQGLTIISRRGNEGIFREMVARPAKLFPDALGRSPKPLTVHPGGRSSEAEGLDQRDRHLPHRRQLSHGGRRDRPRPRVEPARRGGSHDAGLGLQLVGRQPDEQHRVPQDQGRHESGRARPEAVSARGSRLGHRATGSQRAGILPPCRRGPVLPAGLPDSVQPAAAAGLELSGIRPGCSS